MIGNDYVVSVQFRAYDNISDTMTKISNEVSATANAMNRFGQTYENIFQNATFSGIETNLAGASDAVNAFVVPFESVEKAAAGINNGLSDIRNNAESINRSISDCTEIADRKTVPAATGIKNELEESDRSLARMYNKVGLFSMGLSAAYFVSRQIQFVWSKISNTISSALRYSDTVTQTIARISIAGDTEYMSDEIMAATYNAATRSRSDYLATADAVSKMMVRAPDAFSGSSEVIQFTENLNKLFRIAGATTEEQNSATLQLTQALGSGVLRGEEFNAVFEAAPNIMRTIADSMNVPIGSLREMAANGEITADIVKNALLGATDSINEQFAHIPRTWESTVTSIRTTAERAFQKMQDSISNVLNVPSFDKIINAVNSGIVIAADYATRMVNTIATGLEQITATKGFDSFVADVTIGLKAIMAAVNRIVTFVVGGLSLIISYWKVVKSALIVIIPVLGAITASIVAAKIAQTAATYATIAHTVAIYAYKFVALGAAAAQEALNDAEIKGTLTGTSLASAQWTLNTAMYACPVTWIVLGLATIIALVYAATYAYNWLTDSTVSATGIIVGSLATIGAAIYNNVAFIYNWIAGIGEALINWRHPIYSVQRFIANLVTFAVTQFSIIGEAIDKIAGTDITKQMQELTNKMNAHLIATMPDDYKTIHKIEYANLENEFSTGYAMGENLSNVDLTSLAGIDLETGSIENQLAKIEANTASAALSLEMSKDEIGYMRDVSDNRTIANNSISSVKIDMTNNNSMSNGYQADVFVNSLVDSLGKAYKTSASGTHMRSTEGYAEILSKEKQPFDDFINQIKHTPATE